MKLLLVGKDGAFDDRRLFLRIDPTALNFVGPVHNLTEFSFSVVRCNLRIRFFSMDQPTNPRLLVGIQIESILVEDRPSSAATAGETDWRYPDGRSDLDDNG